MKVPISWINQYLFCPYAFYLQHVLGVEPQKDVALLIGSAVHAELERKYKEEGWEQVDIEDALHRAPIENREFRYREFAVSTYLQKFEISGRIDEVRINPDRISIIEDKPGNRVYDGSKYQVMGYAFAFKRIYTPDLPIYVMVRNRDTQEVMWQKMFEDYDEQEVFRLIMEIYNVLSGNIIPDAKPSPKKCERCAVGYICNKKQ